MILYFSATGNCEYAAKQVSAQISDEVVNLFDKFRNQDFSRMHSDRPWVIVTPTYAWRIPRILQAWLEKTELTGSQDIYFVMTCGNSIGNAEKYLKKFCSLKNMNYSGCAEIVMPENYIMMFRAPGREEALQIIDRAEVEIEKASELIKNHKKLPGKTTITVKDKLNSGIVNDGFYSFTVKAKKFYTTDKCISCGKCAQLCPLGNIELKDGKPEWGENCTHCLACVCRCPKEAIEYGNKLKGKIRYTCPK